MISNKRTIALSAIAIAAVLVLFASVPLVATHQAYACWGRAGGGCAGCGWGDWGGWGFGNTVM
jgi:hypothetical protein